MNVADTISHWAAERPASIAVIEDGRSLSFQAFDDAVWRAVAGLRAHGIRPGDVVGVSLVSSALHLVTVYALARLGAVQISLAPDQAAALRQSMIEFFGVSAVVGTDDQPRHPNAPVLTADPGWLEAGRTPPGRSAGAAGDAAGWRIVLSSGTTQAPKGILFSHAREQGWQSRVHSSIATAREGRYLQLIDMSFCYGLRLCMTALLHGAAVVVTGAIDADRFIDTLVRHRITHMAAIPVHLQLLEPALREERRASPAIAELTVAGAVMHEPLRRLIRRRLTPHLHVKYGANEVGYLTAASPALQDRFPDTIGCAVPEVEVEIVDDRGRTLPDGEIGYLRARGAEFPVEYVRIPEASAKAFRDGWFQPAALAAGDAPGAFFFKARADDLMNFDGVKIVPTDIEAALLQHPAVVEAAAFPLPSALHQDVPVAAVVLRQAMAVEELVAFCRERLGVRSPRTLFVLPELPRNPLGKVLKQELARRFAAGRR